MWTEVNRDKRGPTYKSFVYVGIVPDESNNRAIGFVGGGSDSFKKFMALYGRERIFLKNKVIVGRRLSKQLGVLNGKFAITDA